MGARLRIELSDGFEVRDPTLASNQRDGAGKASLLDLTRQSLPDAGKTVPGQADFLGLRRLKRRGGDRSGEGQKEREK
jgi:hypothetical protein